MNQKTILFAAALAAVPLSLPVMAHHSYAMFEMERTVALEGRIVQFTWQNPHAGVEIDARVDGNWERWAIEMTSPNNLIQQGFRRSSMKQGDVVTMQIHPLRSGSKGGSFQAVRFEDGATLGAWQE